MTELFGPNKGTSMDPVAFPGSGFTEAGRSETSRQNDRGSLGDHQGAGHLLNTKAVRRGIVERKGYATSEDENIRVQGIQRRRRRERK